MLYSYCTFRDENNFGFLTLFKVSYPTALDYFVFISFMAIFTTVVQFALVHFFTKVGGGEYYLEELEETLCLHELKRKIMMEKKLLKRLEEEKKEEEEHQKLLAAAGATVSIAIGYCHIGLEIAPKCFIRVCPQSQYLFVSTHCFRPSRIPAFL